MMVDVLAWTKVYITYMYTVHLPYYNCTCYTNGISRSEILGGGLNRDLLSVGLFSFCIVSSHLASFAVSQNLGCCELKVFVASIAVKCARRNLRLSLLFLRFIVWSKQKSSLQRISSCMFLSWCCTYQLSAAPTGRRSARARVVRRPRRWATAHIYCTSSASACTHCTRRLRPMSPNWRKSKELHWTCIALSSSF